MRRRGTIAAVAIAAGLAGCGGATGATSTTSSTATSTTSAHHKPVLSKTERTPPPGTPTVTTDTQVLAVPQPPAPGGPPYPIRTRTITFVDATRTVVIPGRGRVDRRLTTILRYPSDRSAGPFPLVIFGHGFAVTPRIYAGLLTAWARAGYVVAAPFFPLENADAPGGPDERDLINQPADMSFLMTALTGADDPLHTLIDPGEIAVTGQSDGGETALAVAYDRAFRDRRVRAAVILSGAQIPGINQLVFPAHGPPLLATQGTADPINPPSLTDAFFRLAHRPKFLLELDGASHLPPYTDGEPDLGIVERVTIAFLDRYLRARRTTLTALERAGDRPGVSTLIAEP